LTINPSGAILELFTEVFASVFWEMKHKETENMSSQTIVHNTFVVERTYPVTVERAYAAFADPALKRRWYAARDPHDVETFEQDFRVGGIERLQYRLGNDSPFPGAEILNEGTFQDIVPHERIVIATTMSFQAKRVSTSLVTFQFIAGEGQTDLIVTHQGVFFEGADGSQRREEGWRALLERLHAEIAC
jgi:uncharacterized protein YndB with AHSA1/START domain